MKLLSLVLLSIAIATPSLANETYHTSAVKNADNKWMIQHLLDSSTQKKKQRSGVRFATNLREAPPSNVVINVAFHPSKKTNSINQAHQAHQATIA